MRKTVISAVLLIISSAHAYADDLLTGDTRLACEALLCLSSPDRPGECTPALSRYFSIKLKKWYKTEEARRGFLSLCPQQSDELIATTVASNRADSDVDEPDIVDTASQNPTPIDTSPANLDALREQANALFGQFLGYCQPLRETYERAAACRTTGTIEQCQSEIDAYLAVKGPAFSIKNQLDAIDRVTATPDRYCP